jgi:protein-L-isoaspartate(D-aspartate) O-methyltransferase
MDSFKEKRKNMVETQLRIRGINDVRVLEAMENVLRHEFVPENMVPYAYNDEPLSIGEGQTISQPYIVAYMTEILCLEGNEKALEIGTGSGYQSAVLAELTKEVYTVELIKILSERAERVLNKLGYENIHYKIGDGTQGWQEFSPYDVIMVTAAPARVPEALLGQLKEDGRLIIPVGQFSQELVLYEKGKKRIKKKKLIPVRFVPLVSVH